MPLIGEYARRFGVYDSLPPYLSFALGAGETTLLRMVGAYAMFDNGGRKVQPTLIDRIQDRYGRTIYKHDSRECRGCTADKWASQAEPTLVDKRDRVLDPMTAYQITSMMEGVVQRGTATVVKEVGKPLAGKTGTRNCQKAACFIGFSPDLVVGVYLGYDKPRHLGRGATGGVLAAPIVRDFMKVALADKPAVPFRVPPGIKLIRIDPRSGMRAGPGDQRVILEAFKPGTAPSDNYSAIGVSDADGRPVGVSPEADRAIRTGTRRFADLLEGRQLSKRDEGRFIAPRRQPVGIHGQRAAFDRAPHPIVHDDEEDRQLVQGRGVVDGGGIAEHVGAVAEDGHHRALPTCKLGAERRAGAPTQTRRGTRSEIEIGKLEGALLEEQRVLVDDDAVRILGAIDAVAHPRGIERGLAGGGIERSLPGRRQRLALLLDPASTQLDRLLIEAVRECRGQRGKGGNAAPRDGNVAGKAADRVAREQGIESALDDLALRAG